MTGVKAIPAIRSSPFAFVLKCFRDFGYSLRLVVSVKHLKRLAPHKEKIYNGKMIDIAIETDVVLFCKVFDEMDTGGRK